MISTEGLNEKAKFIQHKLPGLEAGEYAIKVSHEFSGPKVGDDTPPGHEGTDTTTPLLYKFAVMGPRFQLDPTAIHSVFPPKNARGEFSNVLPHITLNKQTLPWIRVPVNPDFDTYKAPFGDGDERYDLDVPIWMAVLLLTADDYAGSDLQMVIKSSTVQDLFPGNAPAFISPMSQIEQSTLPPWESLDEPCQTLDIPIDVFNGIAPSLADLFMMANVREVDMSNKAIKPDVDTDQIGTYAVVMGNRIPLNNKRHLAVLVSLEHMQDFLPQWDGTPATQQSGIKFARLPVFHSWNFVSSGDSFKFDNLLESLNGAIVNTSDPGNEKLPDPYLRKYASPNGTPPTGAAAEALELGYVPLKHLTRNGQTTASWYRSPLMPLPFEGNAEAIAFRDANGKPLIFDSDALLRLNPNTGLFDTSYAAAWELGRLLALQDQSFSIALYQWKKNMCIQHIALMEDSVIRDTFSTILQTDEIAETAAPPATPGTDKKKLLEETLRLLSKTFNEKSK